jgi:hypothetical protein
VPAPAKVMAVALVVMVSSEATPVRAPVVETFRPPLALINWKVPVVLPMVTAPVLVVARLRAPVPLGSMARARLVVPVVMSVPMVPEKLRPLVKVPAVRVTLMPVVRVPAPVWLTSKPLAMVLAALVPFRSRMSTEAVATFRLWLMMAAVAPVVALLVELTVRPLTLAAVGETTLLEGVAAELPVGTWTKQVLQVPAVTQLKTPVEAPPSVDRTVPAPPSAVGSI